MRDPLTHITHIVGMASGKGGTGKSTTVVNLASSLQNTGLKVGIYDADIHGSSIPQLTGASHLDVTESKEGSQMILPAQTGGMEIASAAMIPALHSTPAMFRGPMAAKIVTDLVCSLNWSSLDVLLIDLPPGTGDVPMSLIEVIPQMQICVITTGHILSLNEARGTIDMFHILDVPIIGMIENMSYFEPPESTIRYRIFGDDQQSGWTLAHQYGIPFLGEIPIITKSAPTHPAHELISSRLLKQLHRQATLEKKHPLRGFELTWDKTDQNHDADLIRPSTDQQPPSSTPDPSDEDPLIGITDIKQHQEMLRIHWTDHTTSVVNPMMINPRPADESQRQIQKITSAGQYALRIHTTDGSTQIYTFGHIRTLNLSPHRHS